MTAGQVDISVDDLGVATLTLVNPRNCNALDDDMLGELVEGIVRVGRDDAIRCAILTGAGDHFCAGADLGWMAAVSQQGKADDSRRLGNALYQVRGCPKPLIARINGPAIGAGLALALTADIVVAADEASVALPAVRLGIVPAMIGPFITEAVGVHIARRLLLTGETLNAAEARRMGLVHAVAMAAQLDATVERFCHMLLLGGPVALRETKALLNEFGHAPPSPSMLNKAAKVSAQFRRTDEAAEGLAATLDRRPVGWRAGVADPQESDR